MPAEVNDAIRVQELSYAYAPGAVALEQLTFRIKDGESVGLIGPNGAGKTTLFLCLCGVLPVQAGAVCISGLDPAIPAERRLLPAKVGVLFQNSDDQIFNATVADDVAFGPLNLELPAAEIRERVREALARVSLTGLEGRVPFHLSGGEKRRVALAGVLAMRPSTLLLDEPSQFLDPRGRRELIKLIHTLGGTRLIASHDLELIRETCTRVIVLDRGKMVAEGPTRTILADAVLMEGHGLEVPHSLTHHREGEKHHG